MLSTLLVVQVDHICGNLEALWSASSQRIDPIEQILLDLSSLKTVTLGLGLSDLGIFSAGVTVS